MPVPEDCGVVRVTDFIDGDVITYRSEERHCREGMAVVARQQAFDTFWSGGGDRHLLTADELATAELLFNLADFEELDSNSRHMSEAKWNTYATEDRQLITSQHGLQKRWFIRKGAEPSWEQQIANAREKLGKVTCAAESAIRQVGYAQADLTLVLFKAGEAMK